MDCNQSGLIVRHQHTSLTNSIHSQTIFQMTVHLIPFMYMWMLERHSNNFAACQRSNRACVQCLCTPSRLLTPTRTVLTSSSSSHLPLLFLPAHTQTGSQGAQEAEGGGQAQACRRCDMGLLAGTEGTHQPHGKAIITPCAFCSHCPSAPLFISLCFSPLKDGLCSLLQLSLIFLYKDQKACTTFIVPLLKRNLSFQ